MIFRIYIYIYIYTTNLYRHEQVCLMFNEILFWEILLPSLDLIRCVPDVINLQTLNRQVKLYNIYHISVTHKVLKSCRSKMATLEHDVCDVHGASVLHIYKNLLARFVQGFPYLEDGGVPPPTKNLLIDPLHTKFLFPHTESQFNLIKK